MDIFKSWWGTDAKTKLFNVCTFLGMLMIFSGLMNTVFSNGNFWDLGDLGVGVMGFSVIAYYFSYEKKVRLRCFSVYHLMSGILFVAASLAYFLPSPINHSIRMAFIIIGLLLFMYGHKIVKTKQDT